MYSLATCKHIAEIILSDDPALLNLLYGKPVGEVLNYVRRSAPDLDGFEGICFYLEHELKFSPGYLAKFKTTFARYIVDFDITRLPAEYLSVPMAETAARNKVQNMIAVKYGSDSRITDSAWSQIFLELRRKFAVRSYTMNYDPMSGTPVAYIVHAIETFFFKSLSKDVFRTVLSSGLNQEVEGNDFSAIDYHSEEMEFSKDIKDFDVLATNIYKTTDFLYRHNKEVFYDLFSREKFKIVSSRAATIRAKIEKRFPFSATRTKSTVVDSNLVVSAGRSVKTIEYAQKKLRSRDAILKPLDRFIEGVAGLDELDSIIEDMFRVNRGIIESTQGGKEKLPVFEDGIYKTKDKLNRDEKVEALFVAANSILKLFKHFKENNINPLTVPSDIFRDDKIIRRFSSFNWYMASLEETKKLIEGETSSNVLFSNDRVYLDLANRSDKSMFTGISLRGIKDVIDNITKSEQSNLPNTSLVNLEIMAYNFNMWRAFSIYKNPKEPVGKIGLERENHPKIKTYLLSSGMVTNSSGFWEVNTDIPLEGFLRSVYAKREPYFMENALWFANLSAEPGKSMYLGYLRTVEFIEVFLKVVMQILSVLYMNERGERVWIRSKFELFRVINRNRDLFSLPSSPKNYSDFEKILEKFGMEYYMGEVTDSILFNEHMLALYKLMRSSFISLFEYTDSLYNGVYKEYSEGVSVEKVEVNDVKLRLATIGMSLYYTTPVDTSTAPSFIKTKFLSRVDHETGFLTRSGKYYTKVEGGLTQYLHERGYWVILFGNSHEAYPVKEEHF